MGKKGNKKGNDDDDFMEKEASFATKFVSHKAAVAKEAADANRNTAQDDSDDGAANKKQRKRKGGPQELDDLDA